MAGVRVLKRFAVTRRAVESGLLLALAIFSTGARCGTIETEHLFAFTIGSDVGDVGERELEGSVTGRFAKQSGTYVATASTMSVEFVPMANLRTEFTGAVTSYDVAGVSGLLDQRYVAFGGLSADIRYRLLDRATAPFGFAIGAEPHWGRADEVTGEPANQYGVDFVAAADYEIVPDRIVAAFNLLYQPETMRSKITGTWSQESTAGVAFALMAQVRSGIFVGGEARYLRKYDGAGLDTLAGQGFFIGPTIYFKLSEKAWLVAAWSAQAAGQATTSAGSLDLVNFEPVSHDRNFARTQEFSALFGAVLQRPFLDGKDPARLDLDIGDNAGSPALVDKPDVIEAGGRVGDLQTLVVIDGMIPVVVGLVAAPVALAGRRKLQRGDGIGRQVPEPRVLCRCAQWKHR
jgi:hypothetical protein